MKTFYSELSHNAGYYSFGYSIYGRVEAGDNLSDIYEAGFQPCVVVQGEKDLVYMARGSRVRVGDFVELHEHKRIAKKFDEIPSPVEVISHKKEDFKITDEFVDFCLKYFHFRHGAKSMPKERFLEIMHSSFLTHIIEYKISGKTAAYMLEVHTDKYFHFWYLAYAKDYNNKNLGAYMVLDLVRRAKKEGVSYAHLGATYGECVRYKTKYQPLEYWDGEAWVKDEKSKGLKNILKVDGLRMVAVTDNWRSDKNNFYSPGYTYTDNKGFMRVMYALERMNPKYFMIFAVMLFAFAYLFLR